MKKFILLNFIIILSMTIPMPVYPTTKIKNNVVFAEPYEADVVEIDPYVQALENMQQDFKNISMIKDKEEWFIKYKNIVFKYSSWFDPPETIFDYYTDDEVRLICKVVETECYDADFESKVNVANVVLNRLNHEKFGDTIEEVITTENQFAYGRDSITESTINAVMYAFEIEDTTNGALYFHSNEKTEEFNGANYLFTDSVGHHFFK